MPDVAFVISPRQPYPLRELTETLRYELELQGIPSTVSIDGFPAPRSDLVYVLVDPRAYVELEGEEALPEEAVLRRTVVLGAERPGVSGDPERLTLLQRAGVVFDLDPRVVAELRRQGVVARPLKPGYSRLRDHYDPSASRPIDVMFLGAHSLRRTEHLRRCARVLARRNCLLQFSGLQPGPAEGPAFLGESRWPLLAQTKVVINIHRDLDQQFEWLRAVDAIHAGAVVVSEHASGISALEPGRHLLVADGDAVPYVVESLLDDEERLCRIRADAYERLSSWIPFALSTSVFRAALVEVLGRPLHAGVALRGGLHRDDHGGGDVVTVVTALATSMPSSSVGSSRGSRPGSPAPSPSSARCEPSCSRFGPSWFRSAVRARRCAVIWSLALASGSQRNRRPGGLGADPG